MRLVDIDTIKSKHPLYLSIPQPMTVYHSYEELTANEDITKINIITSFDDLLRTLREGKIHLQYAYGETISTVFQKPIMELNLWIKTVDKFIPDTANLGGEIFYVKNAEGQPIPTEGCYIRCYYIIPMPTKLILLCSSGVNSVGITKWEVTAAVRNQYYMEKNNRFAYNKAENYAIVLNKLAGRTKPTVDMYKFVFALLTPNSPCFMDLEKAARVTYGNKIHSGDRNKLLKSPAFRSALMQMFKILMPELKTKAREKFPPEKMIEILATAYNQAVENKKVSEILEVFNQIKEVGYEETQAITDQRQLPDIPLIEESNTGKPKEIAVLGAEEKLVEMNEKAMKEIQDALDYPQGFIMGEEESSETEGERKDDLPSA